MDNISQRISNEDTTTSMYLSFDAESTMSSACYKTLEAMSDTSNLSIGMNNSTEDNQMNCTLEAQMNSQNISALETIKKKNEILDVKVNAPLKALPKNILKEYKAVCSTPSKEQILKTVDVTRGSDASRCVDMGFAFLGIDDEKPAFFPPPNLGAYEENKENVLPDVEEVSTLSTCSSVETITSIIEQKMCPMSTEGSITETGTANDMKIEEIMDKFISPEDKPSVLINGVRENLIEDCDYGIIGIKGKDIEITTKTNSGKCTAEQLEANEERKFVAKDSEVEEKAKPQIAVFNRGARLSVCEPNLQTGKPSRILSANNKRPSLLPTSKHPKTSISAEVEIPLLLNKMLKIADQNEKTALSTKSKEKHVNQTSMSNMPVDKRPSLISAIKTRTSLLTSAPNNKRQYSFTHRMSVVVKTTLNSPARKIARRSALSGVLQSTQKKNVTSQAISSSHGSKFAKEEPSLRKSMVPKPAGGNKINYRPTINILPSIQDISAETTNASSQRKSLYPLQKSLEKDKCLQRTADFSYTCNICKEKFRIKSLLDAHKRSHESDNSPPAFVKKPTTIKKTLSGAVLENSNQCKYCDKNFALTKALHIHLLQNCTKIPPSEKRKLQYTDLNHVGKAQLPNVFPNHNLQSNASSTASIANEKYRYTINKNITAKTSSESLNDGKDNTTSGLKSVNGNNSTESQTTAHKAKKISAHAGVYRTPSKAVPCHLCKLTFKSILDYTNHNLASHGSNKTGGARDTGKDVERIT